VRVTTDRVDAAARGGGGGAAAVRAGAAGGAGGGQSADQEGRDARRPGVRRRVQGGAAGGLVRRLSPTAPCGSRFDALVKLSYLKHHATEAGKTRPDFLRTDEQSFKARRVAWVLTAVR